MRAFPRPVLLAAALIALATPCRAQSADSAAVVGVVQRLFDAMAHGDTLAARALLAPGARLVSIRDASLPPRVQSDTAFLRVLATAATAGPRALVERMWSPEVRLRGPLATVWAPYDFHVNGTFSHCGVDAFTLVREAGAWRVTAITYTVEPLGCAPSPLGPPAR